MSAWSAAERFQSLPVTLPLPKIAVHHLSEWDLITAIGTDARTYLQGQLTCDLISLDPQETTFAAHCDAKGKMHTAMRLFPLEGGFGYIQRKSVTEKQLAEIKKYAVFSKLDFTVSDTVMLGISGEDATDLVNRYFEGDTDVRHNASGSAVKHNERWILCLTHNAAENVISEEDVTLSAQALWDYQDILTGTPRIDEATWGAHIPQALNLQAIDGISFKKGCYTGQEMVARAKYRGINKRAMFIVQGLAAKTPVAGDELERQVGESWRRGGIVIAGARLDDGQAVALAVLPNDLDTDTALRLTNEPDTTWLLQPLPYSLEDDI